MQFSAWLWARDPMAKVAATYAKALTIRDSLRVRDLIDSQWYQDTFNPGWRVVIGQRLHEDDPYGAMLNTGDYVHLNLPSKLERERKCCAWCIEHGPTTQIGFTDPRKEEGELLFPTLFTDKVIKQAEKDLGSYDFAGQHQQRPSPAEGGMFKRTYWRWYNREELPYIEMVVISVDCTFKKVDDADFVAIHVYGVCGARFYLLARRHEQMGFRATKDAIRILWDEFTEIAQKDTNTVMEVHGAGLISDQVALRELHLARVELVAGRRSRTRSWRRLQMRSLHRARMSSNRSHLRKILSNPIQLWMAPQTRELPESLDCFYINMRARKTQTPLVSERPL